MGMGGRERQLISLIESLLNHQTKIDCLVAIFNNNDVYFRSQQIEKILLDTFSSNSTFGVPAFRKLLELQKREKFNFIYAADEYVVPLALSVSLLTNCKFINGSLRHGFVNYFNKRQLFRSIFYRFSKYIIANSSQGYKANKLKINNSRFILYNGVDPKFIECYQNKDYKKNDLIQLLSVSRLHPIKDYETILKALRIVVDKSKSKIKYKIVGDGPNYNKIKSLINTLKLAEYVDLVGKTAKVEYLYENADLFIHSSKSEGCPNVVLEAMACGVPVLATNTGGTPEIINHNTGRLFEYKDVANLANMILELIENETLRDELVINAHNYILKNHTYKNLANKFISILKIIENE